MLDDSLNDSDLLLPVPTKELLPRVQSLLLSREEKIPPLAPSLATQFETAKPSVRAAFLPAFVAEPAPPVVSWEEFRGARYPSLDANAQEQIREQYLTGEFLKSLPAGMSEDNKKQAQAKFRAENPIVADLSLFGAVKEGFGQLKTARRADAARDDVSAISRLVAQSSQDLVINKRLLEVDRKIDEDLKKEGVDRNSWRALWVTTKNLVSDPSALVSLTAQSVASMSTSLAATYVGQGVGGAVGAIPALSVPTGGGSVLGGRVLGGYAAGFAAEFFPERGGEAFNRIVTEARESGIDVSDAGQVERFINSKPGGLAHFYDPAQRKALGTASVSAATNLLTLAALGNKAKNATKSVEAIEKAVVAGNLDRSAAAIRLAAIDSGIQASRTLAARTAKGIGATAAESLGEGASEAAGRYLADEKIDYADAAKEALSGAVFGTTLPIGGAVYEAIRGTQDAYAAARERALRVVSPTSEAQSAPVSATGDGGVTTPVAETPAPTPPDGTPTTDASEVFPAVATPAPSADSTTDAALVLDAVSPGLGRKVAAGEVLTDTEVVDLQSALESAELDSRSYETLRDFLLNLGAVDEPGTSQTSPSEFAEIQKPSGDTDTFGVRGVSADVDVTQSPQATVSVAEAANMVDSGAEVSQPDQRPSPEADPATVLEPDIPTRSEGDGRDALISELESAQENLVGRDLAVSKNLVSRLRRGDDVEQVRQLAQDANVVYLESSPSRVGLSDPVRVAIGSGNASRVLDALENSSQATPLFRLVIPRLKAVGFNEKVGIGLVSPSSFSSSKMVAAYDPSERMVYVANRDGVNDRVVLHELIHAFTLEELRKTGPDRSPSADRMVQYLDVIRKHPLTAEEYGARNTEELVAELWSNQSFRDKIERIDAPDAPARSLLRQIISAIVDLVSGALGLNESSSFLSILDAEITAMLRPPRAVSGEVVASQAARDDQTEQEQIRTSTMPNMMVKPTTVMRQLADEVSDFRTKFVDYQRPFFDFLAAYFGNPQSNAAWNNLKLGRTKRKRLDDRFARTSLKRVNDAAKNFADKYKMDVTEAATILGDYAQMRHVIDANASLQSSGASTFAAGITSQQAQDSIDARIRRYDKASLEAGRKAYVDAHRQLLQDLENARAIAPGTYAALTTQFPNYVPLKISEDSLADSDPWALQTQADGIFGNGMNQSVIMRMKGFSLGTDMQLDNAYATLISRAGAVNARVAFQPFKDAMLLLARSNRAPNELSVVKSATPGPIDKKGMVAFDSRGNRYEIKINSETLADAIYARAVEESIIDAAPLRFANSVQSFIGRNVTKFTPIFPIVNSWLMDMQERVTNIAARTYPLNSGKSIDGTKVAARTLYYATTKAMAVARAASNAVADRPPGNTNRKYYDAAKKLADLGGYSSMGQYLKRDRESAFTELKRQYGLRSVPDKIVKVAEEWGNFWEAIVPTSAFMAFKEEGMSDRQAAASVLELMDFNNKGAGKTAAYIRAIYMFANPAIQGASATFDSLRTPKGWATFAAAVVVASILYQLMLASGEEDEFGYNDIDKRPTNETARYMVFMVGDEAVKFPVGFGVNGVAWATAVALGRYARGMSSAPDAAAEIAKASAKTFSPAQIPEMSISEDPLSFALKLLTPSSLTPLVEVATNKNTFGSPVKREKMDAKDPAYSQGRARTEESWKEISKYIFDSTGGTIDIAPESIKQIWLGYTAGPVAELTKAATFDKDTKGLNTVLRDDLRALSFLGINRFLGGDDRFYETQYYQRLNDAEKVIRSLDFSAVDSNKRLNVAGKAKERDRLMSSLGVSPGDQALVRAYYDEVAKISKESAAKRKELGRTKDVMATNEKYADATEQRMLDFLKATSAIGVSK